MLFPWQFAALLAAGCMMLALACIAQTQKRVLAAAPFSLVGVMTALWCFLDAWILQAPDMGHKILAMQLGLTLVGALPVVLLELTFRFVYERRLLRGWLLVAALIVPGLTAVLAWTINLSPIFRYDCWLDTGGAVPLLRFKQGPWNAIFYGYSYALALWSYAMLLRSIFHTTGWARRARILFMVARLVPAVFDILFHFHALPPVGMNYAPMSFVLSGALLVYILFGDQIGTRAYIARSTLTERLRDLLVVLGSDLRLLDMNPAAASALGMALEAVRGEPAAKVFASWPEVLALLEDDQRNEVEFTRNGRCFELTTLSEEPSPSRAGARILWFRDVTHRKRLELDFLAAARVAEEATCAKDRYLAVMSHEIRSPLNSVLGFMDLLAQTPLDAEQREYVGHISRSGESLMTVINEVLDFSKIEAGQMRLAAAPFHPREEIARLCHGMEREAEAKGLAFHVGFAADLPETVVGDKVRIGQILRNLMTNAIKFTALGGVNVTVDCPERSAADCCLRLSVSDTGVGIEPHELDRLFQPFSQTESTVQHAYGGTGLGLLIVRRLSELMGGGVTVESTPGRGTTFTCRLRLAIDEREVPIVTMLEAAPVLPPLRVLVVDDLAVNRRLLEILLVRMNLVVATAASGPECLVRLEAEAFDVIIMDVEMSGMDGLEAARRVRAMGGDPAPYIIALTAHASPDIRSRCLEAGMNDHLSKPLQRPALERALAVAAGGA